MKNKYPFNAYDNNLCLKPSLGMWLVMLFFLRPYVIIAMSLSNKADRLGGIKMFGLGESLIYSAIAALPAMLIIYAWIKRQPEAGAFVRWIWAHGRILLAGSGLFTILYIVLLQVFIKSIKLSFIEAVPVLVCPIILYYLYKSERVKDTFADFPKNDKQ